MNWILKNWAELEISELYAAYKLRTEVFVVGQGCAYPEVDEHDPHCKHLFAWDGEALAAYARICPPNTVYSETSLGRIVVAEKYRGKGLGKKLMQRALKALKEDFPQERIKIQAQEYLEDFYASFGFQTITESYPDVMVMHVDMVLAEN